MEPCRRNGLRLTSALGALALMGGSLVMLITPTPQPTFTPSQRCNDSRCIAMEHFWRGKLNASVQPCTNFYAFVCSKRPSQPSHISDLPYLKRSLAALYLHLHNVLMQYPTFVNSVLTCCRGYYPVMALDFYRTCVRGPESPTQVWNEVRYILRTLNLDGFPFFNTFRHSMSIWQIASKLDSHMGAFSLILPFSRRHSGVYRLFIEQPDTLQHKVRHRLYNTSEYTAFVYRTMSIFGNATQQSAEQVVEFQQALLGNGSDQPKRIVILVSELPSTSEWLWRSYLSEVLNNASLPGRRNNHVVVEDMQYVERLVGAIDKFEKATVLNYLVFEALVHISPLLPDEFLIPLKLDVNVPLVGLRIQGCLHMLSHLNRYALRYFAGIQVGNSTGMVPDIAYDIDDVIPNKMFDYGRAAMENFIEKVSWIREKNTVVKLLRTMTFTMLAPNISETASRQIDEMSGPPFNKSRPIESFVAVQSHEVNAHWLTSLPDNHLHTLHQLDFFRFFYDYFKYENLLYMNMLPWAVRYVENVSITPFYVPQISRHLMYGINHAIFGDQFVIRRRSQLMYQKCVTRQLKKNGNNATRVDLLDNLLLQSYYEMYMRALLDDPHYVFTTNQHIVVNGSSTRFSLKQLFFLNWVEGYCMHGTTSKYENKVANRVNTALFNFPAFRKSFRCPDTIWTQRSCHWWTMQ